MASDTTHCDFADTQEAVSSDQSVTPVDPAEDDPIRDTVGRKAQACLDCVRSVLFGEALTKYHVTDDNGIETQIEITIRGIRRAQPEHKPVTKPAPPKRRGFWAWFYREDDD